MEEKIASTLDESVALRAILEGTARTTGEHFFDALVINLAKVFQTHGAWVTEYLPETKRFKARALYLGEQIHRDYEMNIEGTPCEVVVRDLRLIHYQDKVQELFPDNPMIREIGTCSYMGVPLLDLDGKLLGHMAVVDRRSYASRTSVQSSF